MSNSAPSDTQIYVPDSDASDLETEPPTNAQPPMVEKEDESNKEQPVSAQDPESDEDALGSDDDEGDEEKPKDLPAETDTSSEEETESTKKSITEDAVTETNAAKSFDLDSSDEEAKQIQEEETQVMSMREKRMMERRLKSMGKGKTQSEKELKKEARSLRRDEIKKKITTVSRPLEISDEEAFLGYALINIQEENDDGKGPALVPSPFQRPLSKRQLKVLADIAGDDGRGLRTRDHENAIIIAVPSQSLVASKLSQSPYGKHTRISWTPEAKSQKMYLIAGSHRQETVNLVTKLHTLEIEKLKKKMTKAIGSNRPTSADKYLESISKIKETIEPQTVWLVMLYDKEKIMETHRKSGSALLKLMTNNRALPAPDTEDYQLKVIFRFCFNAGSVGEKEIMEFTDGLGVNRAAFRRLKLRGGEFLQFVISTRVSTAFELFFVDIERIISIQQNVWGLVGPMIETMWLNLLFVCSNLPLATNGKELFKIVRARNDQTYTSEILLTLLCSVGDTMFSEHLSDCIHLVGSRDSTFKG